MNIGSRLFSRKPELLYNVRIVHCVCNGDNSSPSGWLPLSLKIAHTFPRYLPFHRNFLKQQFLCKSLISTWDKYITGRCEVWCTKSNYDINRANNVPLAASIHPCICLWSTATLLSSIWPSGSHWCPIPQGPPQGFLFWGRVRCL